MAPFFICSIPPLAPFSRMIGFSILTKTVWLYMLSCLPYTYLKITTFEWFKSQEEYQEAQHKAWEHFKLRVQTNFQSWFGKLSTQEQEALYDKFVELDIRTEARKQLCNDKQKNYTQVISDKQKLIETLQAKMN